MCESVKKSVENREKYIHICGTVRGCFLKGKSRSSKKSGVSRVGRFRDRCPEIILRGILGCRPADAPCRWRHARSPLPLPSALVRCVAACRRSYIYERHTPIQKTGLGGFDPSVASFFCGCVVLPLQYLHQMSVAYRDLKPENLLLGQDGYLKVMS